MPDEILTLPEVAGLLKVAEKTVYTMAQRAEIPAFKVRGQWRFKRVDLDRWIEAQKSIHTQPAQSEDAESTDATLKSRGRQNDH
jgi:excisionase family DNA binding protein